MKMGFIERLRINLAVLIMACAILFNCSGPALADPTIPVSNDNHSSTITATNTFQEIHHQYLSRAGATVQNNGTHTMWLYFDPKNDFCATATEAKSVVLAPGASASAFVGNNRVLSDEICITGTATDTFYAGLQ